MGEVELIIFPFYLFRILTFTLLSLSFPSIRCLQINLTFLILLYPKSMLCQRWCFYSPSPFIIIIIFFFTLQYFIGFAIHQHESTMGVYNFKLFLTRYKHALICFVLTIWFSSTITDYVCVLSNVPKLFIESLMRSLIENSVDKSFVFVFFQTCRYFKS